MIFYIFLEIITLTLIGLNIYKIITKKTRIVLYKYEFVLYCVELIGFMIIILSGYDSKLLTWLDINWNFHFLYLISMSILVVLILYLQTKSLKNKD